MNWDLHDASWAPALHGPTIPIVARPYWDLLYGSDFYMALPYWSRDATSNAALANHQQLANHQRCSEPGLSIFERCHRPGRLGSKCCDQAIAALRSLRDQLLCFLHISLKNICFTSSLQKNTRNHIGDDRRPGLDRHSSWRGTGLLEGTYHGPWTPKTSQDSTLELMTFKFSSIFLQANNIAYG